MSPAAEPVAVLARHGDVHPFTATYTSKQPAISRSRERGVDDLLPELADMTVLADPDGPLDDTVPAKPPITVRDLLTYTLGIGMVPAEPGTIPISDALSALGRPSPDECSRDRR
jgi:hypothetical protein